MTEYLGHLLWWTITETTMPYPVVHRTLLCGNIAPPARPLPVDVFRRLTGPRIKRIYPVEDHVLECTLAPVDTRGDSLMTRHMVATVKNQQGVTQAVRKIGDVAFRKPARGKPEKGRMRVVPSGDFYPEQTQAFAAWLRAEYDRGVAGELDAQALRRLVRAHLSRIGAVWVNGLYYLDKRDSADALKPLFALLGESGFLHIAPLVDTDEQRRFVAQHTRLELPA